MEDRLIASVMTFPELPCHEGVERRYLHVTQIGHVVTLPYRHTSLRLLSRRLILCECSLLEFNMPSLLQHKHADICESSATNDRNVLFTYFLRAPQKMFRVIIQLVFVPIKRFDVTNPNRQRRRRGEEMKQGRD